MKYEYIGDQSITIHGNGESGARMSDIELPEATARVRRWTTNSVTVDIPPHLLAGLSDGDALYTAKQVRAAILAERERCARLAEDFEGPPLDEVVAGLDFRRDLAAAIRGNPKEPT